jgi:hypothetical protein
LANFSISFTGFDKQDPFVALGELNLGEDCEHFGSILGFWGTDDYEESWLTALRRLVSGASISCLATSVIDPSNANFLEVWPLYREGDNVYVQNSLIFPDQLSHEFDPDAPWESLDPRSVIDEDGQAISEWKVNLSDIKEFLETKS